MTNAERIKALRICADCTDLKYWTGRERCTISLMRDAADALEAADEKIADCVAAIDALDDSNDAYIRENERLKKRIAELEAQMPKEGEWIWEDSVCSPRTCSVCKQKFYIGRGWNYCPNCGAKMKREREEIRCKE